jgi:hypothetical protein
MTVRFLIGASVAVCACSTPSSGLPVEAGNPGSEAGIQPITISGIVSAHNAGGGTPVAGASVSALKTLDDSLVGSATTASDGSFSILVGQATAVYLDVTATGYVETYLDFAGGVFTYATGAPVDLYTPAAYTLLFTDAGVTAMAGGGVIEVDTLTTDIGPAAGATITITPAAGTTSYDGSNGRPNPTATDTAADGRCYILNASSGSIDASFSTNPGNTDTYSGEIRVVAGKVSQVALHAPFGGD